MCSGLFKRTVVEYAPWHFDQEIVAKLKSLRDERLADSATRLAQRAPFFPKVGEAIFVNAQSFTVETVLGIGAEGVVYLVKTPEGPRAIKKFFRDAKMEANVSSLVAVNDYLTLDIYDAIDPVNRTILMQYVEGVTISDIRWKGKEHGLTESDIQRITGRFETERKRKTPVLTFNILVEFSTGRYYLIDFT